MDFVDREVTKVCSVSVPERCPISVRFKRETLCAFVGCQILAQPEIRLQVPERVRVDLTAFTTVQRERQEDNAADMVGDLLCLLYNGLIVQFCLFRTTVMMSKLSLWFMRNRDTCILGLDEDRSSSCLNRPAKTRCEAVVPTAPQRRLVRDHLKAESLAEIECLSVALLGVQTDHIPDQEIFPPSRWWSGV